MLDFREDVVWNYILSNGYIGTYEANYKTLYNRHDGIYFEIDENRVLKRLKKGDEIMNENILNRRKFIKNYKDHFLECEPYYSSERVVYIAKIYKPKEGDFILFKLSNNTIQAHFYE